MMMHTLVDIQSRSWSGTGSVNSAVSECQTVSDSCTIGVARNAVTRSGSLGGPLVFWPGAAIGHHWSVSTHMGPLIDPLRLL